MKGGWSRDALSLPIGQWVTAQVLLVSTQSVHVMMIRRGNEWSAYATWTVDGERLEQRLQLDDIAAWRALEERDHIPSHVPRKKRLAVVPTTVTGSEPTECFNGHAQTQSSVHDSSRVKSPAPYPRRKSLAVVAASGHEFPGDGRRATNADLTGGGSGDTATAGAMPGPHVDGAREGGPQTRQDGSAENATVHADGRSALRSCATTRALVRSGEPDGDSDSARRTTDQAGGRPAHLDLPRGPTEAEQAAEANAYAARVRAKRFDPSVQPGRPEFRANDFPTMEMPFVAPPPEYP